MAELKDQLGEIIKSISNEIMVNATTKVSAVTGLNKLESSKNYNVPIDEALNITLNNLTGICNISPSNNTNLAMHITYNHEDNNTFSLLKKDGHVYFNVSADVNINKIDLYVPQNFIKDISIKSFEDSEIIINDLCLNRIISTSKNITLNIANCEISDLTINAEMVELNPKKTTIYNLSVVTNKCLLMEKKSNFKNINILTKEGDIYYKIQNDFFKYTKHCLTVETGNVNVTIKDKDSYHKTIRVFKQNGYLKMNCGVKLRQEGYFDKYHEDNYYRKKPQKLYLDYVVKSGTVIVK
ncbi:MAG: hypothetical protein ACK5LT_08075 [Lachnospirales bacterium]